MSLKPRKEFRRTSSAWLASMTNAKGKEKEIAQPVVTLSPPTEPKSLDTPCVDDSAPIASSSKESAEDKPQASTSTSPPNDIPPTPSVPPCQTPCIHPQTSDVTQPAPTASSPDHIPSSDPPASDETQSVNCVNDPLPNITQNTSTETDATRILPEELAKLPVQSADERSWLGTWIGWGTSPSASKTAHGGSTCNGDPDVHRVLFLITVYFCPTNAVCK